MAASILAVCAGKRVFVGKSLCYEVFLSVIQLARVNSESGQHIASARCSVVVSKTLLYLATDSAHFKLYVTISSMYMYTNAILPSSFT